MFSNDLVFEKWKNKNKGQRCWRADEDGEAEAGRLVPMVSSLPHHQPTNMESRPHWFLTSFSAEFDWKKGGAARRLFFFSCRNHAENEVKSCAAARLSFSVGGQVRRESREHRDEARGCVFTRRISVRTILSIPFNIVFYSCFNRKEPFIIVQV